MKSKLSVVMLSPDIDVMGGISFVVREYFAAGLQHKIDLIFIPTTKDGSKGKKLFFFFVAIFKTLKVLLQRKGDIYHLHISQDGSFFRKLVIIGLAKIFNRKVIAHIHGSKFEQFMKRSKINRRLTKKVFVKADRVIVLSQAWKSIVKSFEAKANVVTVFNPIRILEIYEKKNCDQVKILFLGRLSKRKGIYDLLQVVKDHKKYFNEKIVKFIVAGDGEISAVRRFVKLNELNSLIEVPGWVSGDNKVRQLKNADIYLLPSYNEQMPMSILEAMSSGLPIVSTLVAGIPEMVENGKNGILIKPGDQVGLFEALSELIENEDKRRLMGKKSMSIITEKFDTDVIIKQLIYIYNGLKY